MKLRDCGVFGVSSDENLSYATANRAEWVAQGQDVVAEYLKIIESEVEEVPPDELAKGSQTEGPEQPYKVIELRQLQEGRRGELWV